MAEMAGAVGNESDAAFYTDLYGKIKAAFARDYVAKDGSLVVQSQTAHVLALAFNLLNEKQQKIAAFPSWGYEVVNGATSIWERWDSYTKEDGFGRHNAAMNSFSHYAFGAVCEWMFRTLAGIDSDDPGFRHLVLQPSPPAPGSNPVNTPIHWVKAHHDSINGRIVSNWKLENGVFTYDVFLPAAAIEDVAESGRPVGRSDLIKNRPEKDHPVVLEIGAGSYSFRCKYANVR